MKNYSLLYQQIKSLIEDQKHIISIYANVSAFLYHELDDVNWVGFYLVQDGELILGPFQGKVACYTIPYNKGVCGTSWSKKTTLVVDDVLSFPTHIACDSDSRSEIVVPIIQNDEVIAVLDIDSAKYNNFDENIKQFLEEVVLLLVR